jgi:hypothetical protein
VETSRGSLGWKTATRLPAMNSGRLTSPCSRCGRADLRHCENAMRIANPVAPRAWPYASFCVGCSCAYPLFSC